MPAGVGNYTVLGAAPEMVPFSFVFDINGVTTPDGLVDYGNLVASMARSGVGVFVITLRDTWFDVDALCQPNDVSHNGVVSDKSVGAGTNTLTITTTDDAHAASDPADDSAVKVMGHFIRQNPIDPG